MIKNVWVLGAGEFGLKAVERLKRMHPAVYITAIDKKKEIPAFSDSAEGVEYIHGDGIEFLDDELKVSAGPDWIIPAIPVHVACEWIKCRLPSSHDVRDMDLPERITALLPNALRGADGELYSSMADFLCPDDCSEPLDMCSATKTKRPYRLYDLLASLELEPFKTVVRSRQLCAGAGGYRPVDLFRALKEVQQISGPILLSTSCSVMQSQTPFVKLSVIDAIVLFVYVFKIPEAIYKNKKLGGYYDNADRRCQEGYCRNPSFVGGNCKREGQTKCFRQGIFAGSG